MGESSPLPGLTDGQNHRTLNCVYTDTYEHSSGRFGLKRLIHVKAELRCALNCCPYRIDYRAVTDADPKSEPGTRGKKDIGPACFPKAGVQILCEFLAKLIREKVGRWTADFQGEI